MAKEAFYLKVNRSEEYAMKNLSRWIDISYLMDADCYIICDKPELEKKIREVVLLYREVDFVQSEKRSDLAYIVNHIANRNWINASFAHLTAIWHGCEHYDYFWNIDADDTRFCVSINKMHEILQKISLYAKENEVDCFSLDMWNSETKGTHWSFGVSFLNGNKNMIELCVDRCTDSEYHVMDKEGNSNIDWFFTYLRNKRLLNIKSYYVENLRFIHYSNDFFEKPIGSGLYHWKGGKLVYPLMYYGIGIKEQGIFDIQNENIRIDAGITDEESSAVMAYYTREGKDLGKYYEVNTIVNEDICQRKFAEFVRKHGYQSNTKPEIICFGAGNALEKNLEKIKKIYEIRYVCDNDESKWGRFIVGGIKCISPEQVKHMKNIIVIILVYSLGIVKQIAEQLSEMDVDYDYMDSFLRCVE